MLWKAVDEERDQSKKAMAKSRMHEDNARSKRLAIRLQVLQKVYLLFQDELMDLSAVALAVAVKEDLSCFGLIRYTDGRVLLLAQPGFRATLTRRAIFCPDGLRLSHRGKVIRDLAGAIRNGLPYSRPRGAATTQAEKKCAFFSKSEMATRELCRILDRGDALTVLAKHFPVHHLPETIAKMGSSRAWLKLPVTASPVPVPRKRKAAAPVKAKKPAKRRKKIASSEDEDDDDEDDASEYVQ